MEFEKLISLILSIGVFLYLFFRDLKKENANGETPQKRKASTEGYEKRHGELLDIFKHERQGKKKLKSPKPKPAPDNSWMKHEYFPETVTETVVSHKLGNPWQRDAYKPAAPQIARGPLVLLKNRRSVKEAMMLTEILNKPRVTNPYTEWHPYS